MSSGRERILAVERIVQERKIVSTQQIVDALWNRHGIRVNRKTIYDDIAVLTAFMPIDTIGYGMSFRYVLRPIE